MIFSFHFSSLRQIIPKAKREVNLNDQKISLNSVLSNVTFSIFVYALRRKVSETAPKSILDSFIRTGA